jgi:hypothetical protein
MAEQNGAYDWDKHGEEHERVWTAIHGLYLSVEGVRDSIMPQRDNVQTLTGAVESLVEAARNDVAESKALRVRLESQEERSKRLYDEYIQRHIDLMTELQTAKAENRDLLAAIRKLLDRIPPGNLGKEPRG